MMIEYKIVKTKKEILESFRIRHQVYCIQNNYIISESGIESDKYDIRSNHYIAIDNDQIIGTIRFIHPYSTKRFLFPMESLYDLSFIPKEFKYIESSRLAVLKQYYGGLTIFNLWKILISHASFIGYTHIILTANPETNDLNIAEKIYQKGIIEEKFIDKFPIYSKNNLKNQKNKTISYNQLLNFKYPSVIKMHLKLGAKFIGNPVFYPKVNMCAVPMIINIKEIPEPYYSKIFIKNPYDFKNMEQMIA